MNDDVIEDILARSDVKDVLRCKSVCKSWYSLISSPYFVKSHLLKHKSYCNTRINNNDVGNIRIAMPTYWKITNDDPNLYQSNIWNLNGSSNGLVCVSSLRFEARDDRIILLINPRTREVRELPLPTMPPEEDIFGISLSFGYDSSTDDYKLLIGINKKGVDKSLVQVFSLKSMTWKLIGHINYLLIFDKSGVLLNGAFHWFASDERIKKQVILSFDLSQEEFKEITLPERDDSTRYVIPYSTLGIFQDNLCMSCVDENEIYYGLWIMRDNNSWELLPNDYEIKSPDAVYYMKIYACTSLTEKRMGFFCDYKACFSRSLIHTIRAPLYVQSLVSPYLNTEMPSHPGSVKVAEREGREMRIYEMLRKNTLIYSEEMLRAIMELYKREGGENEKSYLREDGETNMNKKKSRGVNMYKIENSASGKKLLSTNMQEDDLPGKKSVKKGKSKFMQTDVEVIDAPQSAAVSREVTIDLAKERGGRGKRDAYTCAGNEGSYQKSGGQGQGQSVFVRVSGEYNDFDNLRANLEGLLSGCGEILRLSIPKDYNSGFPKGIAFIDFADNKGFIKALQLSGTEVGGGCIYVTEAKSRGGTDNLGYEAFGSEKVEGLSGGDRKGKRAMSFEDVEMDVDDSAELASKKSKRKKSNSKSTENEANVIADGDAEEHKLEKKKKSKRSIEEEVQHIDNVVAEKKKKKSTSKKSKKKSKSKSNKHEALDGDAEAVKKKKRKRSIKEEAQPIDNVADDSREKKKKKKRSKDVELEDLPAVSKGKKKKKKKSSE